MAQEFVQAHLLDLGDARDAFPFRFMALEPWITGKYEKFTSNAGHIAKDSDLAQAYSHFTWEWTSGEIMVVDIQGVGNTLTDPQIHSLDTGRFGRGNLSTKGMDAGWWVQAFSYFHPQSCEYDPTLITLAVISL